MKLSENIKFFRKKRKLTQEKLAELVLCSIDTLQRWENDSREPKASDIVKLCEIFNCTEKELLNGSNDERIRITMSYDWNKMKEAKIDMTGNEFTVCLGANGEIGLNGAMKFTSRETIKEFLAKVAHEVEIAFDAQVKRGVIQEA